jgi:phosphoribosylaminoimidazole-succinocarboxamide synthase
MHHLQYSLTTSVRDLYEIDSQSILFIATDRISAFDVVGRLLDCATLDTDLIQVLENGIPDKGAILTRLTAHWFSVLSQRLPGLQNHFLSMDLPAAVSDSHDMSSLQNRSMVVRKLKVFPIESIVRGYITGSAWSEYKSKGTVNGMEMPEGLVESQKLAAPLWTPSTKAEMGEKDENISPEQGLFPPAVSGDTLHC